MPYKHQLNSYRTRGGLIYKGYGDFAEGSREYQKAAAKAAIATVKAAGGKAFMEYHADGYYRVFYRGVSALALPSDRGTSRFSRATVKPDGDFAG